MFLGGGRRERGANRAPNNHPLSSSWPALYGLGTSSVLDFLTAEEYNYLNWLCKEKKKKNKKTLKRERFSPELFSSQPLVRTQLLAHRASELHSYSHNIHVQQSPSDSFKNVSSWVWCCLPGMDNLCNASLFVRHKWDARATPSRS